MDKLKVSQRIRAALQEGEDILTSLLGLIIAISGLIAFADVFSNGRALAFLPWLLWVWIVSQAVAVDYMFYIATKRQFTMHNVEPFVYWSRWVLIVVLGVLVVFVGAIFTVNETQGGAISASMQVLGIPSIAFMYARAAAPVLLLFVIGIDHALDRVTPLAQPPIAPDVVNVLVEKLEHLTVTVNQLTNPSMPALPEQAESLPDVPIMTWHEDGKVDTVQFPGKDPVHVHERNKAPANPEPIYQGKFMSKEQEIAAILARMPGASVQEIAQEARCSVRTAEKWIQRLVPQGEE